MTEVRFESTVMLLPQNIASIYNSTRPVYLHKFFVSAGHQANGTWELIITGVDGYVLMSGRERNTQYLRADGTHEITVNGTQNVEV